MEWLQCRPIVRLTICESTLATIVSRNGDYTAVVANVDEALDVARAT